MTHKSQIRSIATALPLACLAAVAFAAPAAAGDLTDRQIVEKLKQPPLTRSLSGGDAAASKPADRAFIERIRRTRSLSVGDRQKVAEIAKDRPTIDLEIYFDYDSAAISPKAEPQLHHLGKALSDPALADSVMMLGGHTDAKGKEGYNQALSERRAETIRNFLVETYKIPADNLVTAGYGESELKNPADPYAAENRRVQVINMAKQEQASR